VKRATPAARSDPPRTRVLATLHAVLRRGEPTGVALARALGPIGDRADRAFLTDLAYGTLRWLPTLDAALAPWLPEPERLPYRVRDALRVGAYERLVRGTPDHAAVHAWVEVVKRAGDPDARLAGLVNAVLRRVDLADVRGDAAAVSLSPALWHHLRRALGPMAAPAARAMRSPEPLWLTAHRDDAVERLRAEGADVRPGPLPLSLAVRLQRPLAETEAFREGLVQPQNPSSAAVVTALGSVAGRTVLDVGSGHGVKAAQLAAAGATVLAVEVDPRRAASGRRNLARLGRRVQHHVLDASRPLRDLPMADAALLDAPCTGTGTLRGHPEIKLRWRPDDARAAAARQAAMLASVADRVAPGGCLVYAVCALGLEEGPEVVAAFLAAQPAWRSVPPQLPLPTHPAPVGAWLLPDDAGLDGFYVARLERTGAA